jgi:hypothetical protein
MRKVLEFGTELYEALDDLSKDDGANSAQD